MDKDNQVLAFDVLIVGGGMVGAAAAVALGGTNLRVGLLDAARFHVPARDLAAPSPAFDVRVSAISPASRQFFQTLGCWEDMVRDRVSPYTQMQVWDEDGTGTVHFSAADIHQPELGHIIENRVILNALYRRLQDIGAVTLLPAAKLAQMSRSGSGLDSLVTISTDSGDHYTCRLLVGADGTGSRVRELAGFKLREWDYQHTAIVTSVQTEHPHGGTAWQKFMSTGPLAFLPLSPALDSNDQHYCSIVWSATPELADELLGLSDAGFCLRLQQVMEGRFGIIQWADNRMAFPLRQRHATSYVVDGVVLIGDAAHSIHPLAGQGVNLGLADVRVLVEEVSANLQRGRAVNELLMLRRYERRRMPQNLGMMWMMEGFKRLFAADTLPLRWARNVGMRFVDGNSLLRNRLIRQATGY